MPVLHYQSEAGVDLYQEWLDRLTDLDARVRIVRRVDRVANGHFGDCKFCRDGVWELRIDCGPGYRVYYAKVDGNVVLLLCGGDKRKQARDISRAIEYLADYKRRLK
jgi:putative addiction module killer protein